MNSETISDSYSRRRFRILGICWVIYGVLETVTGFWLFSFWNTATVMFGALLSRAPNPFALMDEFHFLYAAAIVLAVICGVFGILGGWALLADLRSARILVMIAAILSLPWIPLGTTLGIFSLIMLFISSYGETETAHLSNTASHPKTAAPWPGAANSG